MVYGLKYFYLGHNNHNCRPHCHTLSLHSLVDQHHPDQLLEKLLILQNNEIFLLIVYQVSSYQ